MATQPVLVFHGGRLDVPEELQRDWQLQEGTELCVVSSSPNHIVLAVAEQKVKTASEAMAVWNALRGILPDRRTPEWEAYAVARKREAQENLDRLYRSGTATTTELKAAEREWELADDELDFGPFCES